MPQAINEDELLGEWRCRPKKLGGIPPPRTIYGWFKSHLQGAGSADRPAIVVRLSARGVAFSALETIGSPGAATVNDDPIRVYGEAPKEDEVGIFSTEEVSA